MRFQNEASVLKFLRRSMDSFAILRIFEQNWESNSLCEQAPGKGEKN